MTDISLLQPAEQAFVARAHNRLVRILEGHGNVVAEAHSAALHNLLSLMTAQAFGRISGRYVAPLPTGSGKTTAIIAWITELVSTWDDEIPICVSMFTVEALCRLYRSLLESGLTADRVGLIHSYGDKASESSLEIDQESKIYPYRQIVLVSHSRLRDNDLTKFYYVGEQPRALTIFDESLVTSKSAFIEAVHLHAAHGAIRNVADTLSLNDLLWYLDDFAHWFPEASSGNTDTVATFKLPDLTPDKAKKMRRQFDIFEKKASDGIRFKTAVSQAIAHNGETGRLIRSGGAKLVFSTPNFPDEIDNMLILDASYQMKLAERFDTTVHSGEEILRAKTSTHVDLTRFKRFDNVTIKTLPVASGRDAIRRDLKSESKEIFGEVIECVRNIPHSECVLIVTFKDLGHSELTGSEYLVNLFKKAGLDVEEPALGTSPDRRRINVLTWGQEASLNDFGFCQHVILYGLNHQDGAVLASLYLGARRDINADYGPAHLTAHKCAELAQSAFQALSRGSCRHITDGRAHTMTGYVMSTSQQLLDYLSLLMPGIRFEEWPAVNLHDDVERDREVVRIRQLMQRYFDDQFRAGGPMKISGVQLNRLIQPSDSTSRKTVQRRIEAAMEGMLWFKQGKSYYALDLRGIEAQEFMGHLPK
ncbi:MAG: hypothetical protein JJ959_11480 [Nisaea sp.]|uniref:hypothetical protein n=1 Tax=Nisaea sp. TaxID=2024842 RepID=UPI001B0EF37D|nr:hypothetical protein [Nisaea sp.]MBO6561154.1 hypothetical protein [Nisaea sp.]